VPSRKCLPEVAEFVVLVVRRGRLMISCPVVGCGLERTHGHHTQKQAVVFKVERRRRIGVHHYTEEEDRRHWASTMQEVVQSHARNKAFLT